jgi:hypothetical protein
MRVATNPQLRGRIMSAIPLQERYDYIDNRNITINGKSAIISGAKCDHALVRSLDGSIAVVYSWYAVKYVIEHKSGNFKT